MLHIGFAGNSVKSTLSGGEESSKTQLSFRICTYSDFAMQLSKQRLQNASIRRKCASKMDVFVKITDKNAFMLGKTACKYVYTRQNYIKMCLLG